MATMTTPELLMAIAGMIFASTGFWTFVNNVYQEKKATKSAERRALLGLLHEQLSDRYDMYVKRGSITRQEFEDLRQYIYGPYRELGGNGTGEVMFHNLVKLLDTQMVAHSEVHQNEHVLR